MEKPTFLERRRRRAGCMLPEFIATLPCCLFFNQDAATQNRLSFFGKAGEKGA